jgi:hypothetical protein
MNGVETRNDIMAYHLKQSKSRDTCRWWGTWFVRESGKNDLSLSGEHDPVWKFKPKTLHDLVRRLHNKTSACTAMFTVCLLYDVNLVHYVSFVYLPSERVLLSFDPGVEVYPHGQKTIVPRVHALMKSLGLVDAHRVEGACSVFRFRQKKHGVQFNGRTADKLPADAFCQSWTLFFLVRVLYLPDRSLDRIAALVRDWCRIPPEGRQYFLTSFFILPTLTYFSAIGERYVGMLGGRHGKKEAVEAIFAPLEQCFFTSRSR